MEIRITEERVAFLKKISLLAIRNVSPKIRKKFINSFICSVFTHGSEIWTLKKLERSHLEDFEVWCWKRTISIPRDKAILPRAIRMMRD